MADLPACLWDRPAHVHLIGMGGVGMAGLARLLIQSGFTVSGSDSHPNRLTRDLEAQGAQFFAGHHPDHPPRQTEWAVRTPAVGEGNPEVEALRERQIPVWVRGQVLASFSNRRRSVAVAGAHGKTTTSAMLATILEHARSGAGYAVGGETGLPGRVADRGSTEAFVLEADESDGTLVHYAPAVGILTHVEWDHVERFRSESSLLRCYRRFAEGCGVRWIREGDLLAEQVSRDLPQLKRVGESTTADLQFLGATESPDGQEVRFGFQGGTYSFRIPLPGRHNAMNALLAVAAAGEL
ncbi:MAG: Mur ligase domain-containing protein, partial [Kiritimatiellia bacterium]